MDKEQKLYSVRGTVWVEKEIETNGKKRNTKIAQFVVFEKNLDFKSAKEYCKKNKGCTVFPNVPEGVKTLKEEMQEFQQQIEVEISTQIIGTPELQVINPTENST